MARLVALLVTRSLVAIPAEADVDLRPVPGWTVIQVYGEIKPPDVRYFRVTTRKTSIRTQPWSLSPARAATSRLVSALVRGFT